MFRHKKSRHVRRPSPRVAAIRVEALLNNPEFKYLPSNFSRSI
jgi:hypothetical protein